jgi:hypothetical protein
MKRKSREEERKKRGQEKWKREKQGDHLIPRREGIAT